MYKMRCKLKWVTTVDSESWGDLSTFKLPIGLGGGGGRISFQTNFIVGNVEESTHEEWQLRRVMAHYFWHLHISMLVRTLEWALSICHNGNFSFLMKAIICEKKWPCSFCLSGFLRHYTMNEKVNCVFVLFRLILDQKHMFL